MRRCRSRRATQRLSAHELVVPESLAAWPCANSAAPTDPPLLESSSTPSRRPGETLAIRAAVPTHWARQYGRADTNSKPRRSISACDCDDLATAVAEDGVLDLA